MPSRALKKPLIRRLGEPTVPWLVVSLALFSPQVRAVDIVSIRDSMAARTTGPAPTGAPADGSATGATSAAVPAAVVSAQERMTRIQQNLDAVRAMQQSARALAVSGANNLKPNLPVVPVRSFGVTNGLVLAPGVPKDLANPGAGEKSALWTGARLPVVATDPAGGQTVTIKQTEQQAVLNWQTFNVGKETTVDFNQADGGANAGRWTAFNVVRDPTANPTQILGTIRTTGAPDAQGKPQVGGQVYVLNTNGVIFGGSSQVNTHGLVAAALPLNHNTLKNGLLNNPDTQFQFSVKTLVAGEKGTPAFDPAIGSADGSIPEQTSFAANGRYGDIEVQAGAVLNAPTNADRVGGRVALVGANVRNAGTISTPNGQTILAAGLQVGFAASRDPSLRGLDTYVGDVGDYGGTVANGKQATTAGEARGIIDGRRADGSIADVAVTLVGKNVGQLGAIDASTSVSLNGRVDLLAEYNAIGNRDYEPGKNFPEFLHGIPGSDDGSTGLVTLGADSINRILPETGSTEKIVGATLKLPSLVNLRGQSVHLAGTAAGSGAAILAPGAQVNVDAGRWSTNGGVDTFLHPTGQIYFDAGASVDVSGSRAVQASVADNIVEVELRGPQLADYPLLRDGPLRGQTVKVDLRQTGTYNGRSWIGTPLADASGYVGLVQRTVGQLTTGGGSVRLAAGDSVVLNANTAVDVSGGWIDYLGAELETTKLLADGHIFDIAQATPDRNYAGIYTGTTTTTDPKWGVTTTTGGTYPLKTYEAGYRQGGAGGALEIAAPALVLDGKLTGQTYAGPRQRTPAGQLAKTYGDSSMLAVIQSVQGVPKSASLGVVLEQQYLDGTSIFSRSPTPPTVRFTLPPATVPAVPAFPTSGTTLQADLGARGKKGAELVLAPGLTVAGDAGSGFGSLSVRNPDGDIRIESDLRLTPGGALNLDAANISVAAGQTVAAPGGSLAFTTHNLSPSVYQVQTNANVLDLPAPDPARGRFSLGLGATLSTAGLVVDQRAGHANTVTTDNFTNGYRQDASGAEVDAVSVSAYRLELADDSRIDVSGGATVAGSGRVTYGGAGRITLAGVLDPQSDASVPLGQSSEVAVDPLKAGYLRFNPAKVRFIGYAGQGAKTGTLALQAQHIQIENAAARAAADYAKLLSPGNLAPTSTLVLTPDFFGRDGIGNYSLTGLGSVARNAQGGLLADAQGPGRLYVPGVYVLPALAGTGDTKFATTVTVQPYSWVASLGNAGAAALIPATELLPLGARAAGSFRLNAPGVNFTDLSNTVQYRGDLKFGDGATLRMDPKSTVSLSGGTVQFDGVIEAPAGNVTLTGASTYFLTPDVQLANSVLPTVELGVRSRVNAAGVALPAAGLGFNDGLLGSLNTGSVLAGGSVAVQGNVVARKGSILDVSGAAGTLDLLPSYGGGGSLLGRVPTRIESNGGSINLKGAWLLASNATLRGAAGGSSAQGGSLSVTGTNSQFNVEPSDLNLEVSQKGPSLPATGSLLGRQLVDAQGVPLANLGYFGADDFWNPATKTSAGGLGSLTLEGNVRFAGSVNLGATRSLKVATGGFVYSSAATGSTSQAVALSAPSVSLGLPFEPPVSTNGGVTPQISIFKRGPAEFYREPTPGAGSLSITADKVISLGSVSFQGISTANFATASGGQPVAGDVRGDGVVDIAGSLSFTAGQVYPVSAVNFTLAAYDHLADDGVTNVPGSVTFNPVLDSAGKNVLPALPLSAGGVLTVYGSRIDHQGVLRAPFGRINLGWNGTGPAPTQVGAGPADLITGNLLPVPVTESLTLGAHSLTAVSGVDPLTGQGVTVPYGYSTDGLNWFDPAGTDITTLGPPTKNVSLSAQSVDDKAGSVIDLSGGGELYAYRWVPGVGGSRDVLAADYVPNPSSPGLVSYAVLPTYESGFAPYGAFGAQAAEKGYVAGASLAEGDIVHLDLGDGRGARDYTLLPARYALLSGAFLVTPVTGAPPVTPVSQPDGAKIVAGYRRNNLEAGSTAPAFSAFEVARGTVTSTATDAPKSIVRQRSQYADFLANSVFRAVTASGESPAWRLPLDAGSLRLLAAGGGQLSFDGQIRAGVAAGSGGRGGLVDISTTGDILITGSGASTARTDALIATHDLTDPLVLRAATLNQFGAESLLLGGHRESAAAGAAVTVDAAHIVVANQGEALTGTDVILAAKTGVTLDDQSSVRSQGTLAGADKLVFGRTDATTGAAVAGSGNGVVVRVSSDADATVIRQGVNQSTAATLQVGTAVKLGAATGVAGSVTLDSTNATDLDPTTAFSAKAVSFGSGQISIQFPGAGVLRPQVATDEPTTGLVLSGQSLNELQSTGAALGLLSYSSLDFYGTGELGGTSSPALTLQTPEIHGDGGDVTIRAQHITLGNSSGSAAPDAPDSAVPAQGTLLLAGEKITFGAGSVAVQRYGNTRLEASTGLDFTKTGNFAAGGDLSLATPLLTGATAAQQRIAAAGTLTLAGTPASSPVVDGLGATLSLEGDAVVLGSAIRLPSGTVNVRATGPSGRGDIQVGGVIDVSGTAKAFFDLPKYTDGGLINLVSAHGNATVTGDGTLNVSGAKTLAADATQAGHPVASRAGSIAVVVEEGRFTMEGGAAGQGGTEGEGGAFSLDAGSLSGADGLDELTEKLAVGSFDRSQQFRVRTGDVTLGGTARTHEFSLSTDRGSITLDGKIDASGRTGGVVSLNAHGAVSVGTDGEIDASGQEFDGAGKGGSVLLAAGSTWFAATGAPQNPAAGASVDLGGKVNVGVAAADTQTDGLFGRTAGTVRLRAPQIDGAGVPIPAGDNPAAGVDVAVKPISGSIIGASSVIIEGQTVFTPPAGVIDTVEQAVQANGTVFAANAGAIRQRLLAARPELGAVLRVQPGAEIVNPTRSANTLATLTAGTGNSTLFLPAGAAVSLDSLVSATGRIVSLSGTGRLILPDGKVTPLPATSTNIALPAGSRVVFDTSGALTLALTRVGGAGSGTLSLESGASLTSSLGGSLTTATGTVISLNSVNQSAVTVPAATAVVVLNNGDFRFSSAGFYRAKDGTTVNFAAAATETVPAGSVVTLSSGGTITYAAGSDAVQLALSGGTYQFARAVKISPGAGDLQLAQDWDLSTARYGGEPGSLRLRAAGNLVFNGALSDGFASAAYDAPLLAAGSRSTDYGLTAGADLSAVDSRRVLAAGQLSVGTGSVLIGQNGLGQAFQQGDAAQTKDAVDGHFQVVRTGTGDITVNAGRDVLLLNQFASIYTAGTQVADPTMGGVFDVPVLDPDQNDTGKPLGQPQQETPYAAQFAFNGGNVSVAAGGDIAHKARDGVGRLVDDSGQQLPNNWVNRRGLVDPQTGRFFQGTVATDPDTGRKSLVADETGEVKSTAWWVDYSNFFEGVGTLGGGHVRLEAGRDIMNVDAVVPTNARMAGRNADGAAIAPDFSTLVELGGGDLRVQAGRDINGGVYYVERGRGDLAAGRSILTNVTRRLTTRTQNNSEAWLPTTLFLGKGRYRVQAGDDLRLGPVANVFLMPAGINNTVWNKTYFSTYDPGNAVEVASLTGDIRLSENSPGGFLSSWLSSVQQYLADTTSSSSASYARPWLRLSENSVGGLATMTTLAPATLKATAFSGDLDLAGNLTLSPSPTGTVELAAAGSVSALNRISISQKNWGYGTVRLLDSDPAAIPGPATPLATVDWTVGDTAGLISITAGFDGLLQEDETTDNDSLPTKLARHGAGPLHAADTSPVRVYSATGDITGFGLMAGKSARIVAGRDVTDVSFILQNNRATDISVIGAGRDLVAYSPNSPRRQLAAKTGFTSSQGTAGRSGRIEIGGPGTLEVLAGRNLDLGVDPASAAPGLVSVGSARNPRLPFGGADLVAAAGLGGLYETGAGSLLTPGFLSTQLDFGAFVEAFLRADTVRGKRYLPLLGRYLGLPANATLEQIAAKVAPGVLDEKTSLAVARVFFSALRAAGRDRNDPKSDNFGTYDDGLAAIKAMFPGTSLPTKEQIASHEPVVRPVGAITGSLLLPTRVVKTFEGGNVSLLAPNGGVTVGRPTDAQKSDQGVLTERGGDISIYAADNVDVGTSRIFTLRGGDEVIWSTWGNIAAGSGSKTVFAAPPTRVLIDPQSGDVQTDLSGLATGSGIGVLATLAGVKPGDIDLIAPVGTVDAGDAGIRASGNLNIAAAVVLNAANIQVGGASAGTPPPPPAPNLGSLGAATAASAASSASTAEAARQGPPPAQAAVLPSIITVEVVGYGGETEPEEEDTPASGTAEEPKKSEEATPQP